MSSLKISFKDNCDFLFEALGISEERYDELEHRIMLIVHEYMRPLKKHEVSQPSDQILKLCIALAENQQELILCAYAAGMKVEEIFGSDFFDEQFEEGGDRVG